MHAEFWSFPDFSGAIFGGEARFSHAEFDENAIFNKAIFGKLADFTQTKFGTNERYTNTAAHNFTASFSGATFKDLAVFSHARFGTDTVRGTASFEDAVFENGVDFDDTMFHGDVRFLVSEISKTEFKFRNIDFSKTKFFGPCSFENRNFVTSASFNDAEFHDLVEFHGCSFHQGMSFHQTKFLKTKEDKLDTKKKNDEATEALERAYRTLKLDMETLRARNEEAMFYALEMEARRQRSDVPRIERFAAISYKYLSDYGRAVDLPLIWLLVLGYVSHYLYLAVAFLTCNPGSGMRLAFLLEQMFRPFYVWSTPPGGTVNCLISGNPLLIPLLASVQSLATIGLLTLFLLALRRRFKMD